MNPLYDLAMKAYDMGIRLAAVKNPKAALLTAGRRQSLSLIREKIAAGERPVWVHAASLGEFEQGRPLIERLKEKYPDRKIVLTFFSPSGYEVRKNYALADAVCYLPADTTGAMREFIGVMDPVAAVFVKYEFWRNALETLHKRGVPTYLVSAVFRPDQMFFRPYGAFYRKWLRWFRHIFVQDERSRRLLLGIGVRNVTVAGDTRFDRVANIRDTRKEVAEVARFVSPQGKTRPEMVMVAGSSWGPDEEVYGGWIKEHPEVRLILAPHEFDAERLKGLKRLFGEERTVLLSEAKENIGLADSAQVMIIDCFGLLSSLYAYGDAAYIGGGFGVGIHNINEAAVYGIPVMYGPNNSKFIEAQEMKACGGGLEIGSESSFRQNADRLLSDPDFRKKTGQAAGDYIASKLGASDRIFPYMEEALR